MFIAIAERVEIWPFLARYSFQVRKHGTERWHTLRDVLDLRDLLHSKKQRDVSKREHRVC